MNDKNENELKDFIKETLRQISEGSAGYVSVGEVDFEVAVAKVLTASGKVGVTVLGTGLGGEMKKEDVSKVKFSIRIKGASNRLAPTKWPPFSK